MEVRVVKGLSPNLVGGWWVGVKGLPHLSPLRGKRFVGESQSTTTYLPPIRGKWLVGRSRRTTTQSENRRTATQSPSTPRTTHFPPLQGARLVGEGQRTTTQSPSTSERVAGGWESKDYHLISLQAKEGGWWVGVEGPLPISLQSKSGGLLAGVGRITTYLPPLRGGRLVGGCHANFIPKQDVDFQTSLIISPSDMHKLLTLNYSTSFRFTFKFSLFFILIVLWRPFWTQWDIIFSSYPNFLTLSLPNFHQKVPFLISCWITFLALIMLKVTGNSFQYFSRLKVPLWSNFYLLFFRCITQNSVKEWKCCLPFANTCNSSGDI